MERERFRRMRKVLRRMVEHDHLNPRQVYTDSTILLVALWAALHDKPISWACDGRYWPGDLRPTPLPSQPCMSRRLRTVAVLRLVDRLEHRLRDGLTHTDVKFIDSRPLPVGRSSKDRDAAIGHSGKVPFKGYKLHALADLSGTLDGWIVQPASITDQRAAEPLIQTLQPGGWLIADRAYDKNRLYDLTHERGVQLLANPPRHAKALGHRRHSPARRRVWAYLHAPVGRRVLQHRVVIEQVNGRIGCSAVGLDHLPYHARRLHRVTLWVGLKLLIFADLQAHSPTRSAA